MKKITKALIISILLLSILPSYLHAQQIRELHVGDKLPDIVLHHVYHSASDSVRLKELYKGKSLLISFWASWCVPCIREMKGLDSIAPPLADKLHLLTVTYQDEKTMSDLLTRQKINPGSYRTLISSDTILRMYFPYKFLPQNIWVNAESIITGITGGDEVSKENVLKFTNGQLKFKREKHDNMAFDYFKPYHINDSSFVYRSILGNYNPSINSGMVGGLRQNVPGNDMGRLFMFNSSLLDVLWFAYFPYLNNATDINYKRLKVITSDSTHFFYPKKIKGFKNNRYVSEADWYEKNLFCYELQLASMVNDTLFGTYVLEDMHRNFKFHSWIEQTEMPGWQITKLPDHLERPQNDSVLTQETLQHFTVKNISVTDLINYLENLFAGDPDPIIDVTNDNRHFNFRLANDGKGITMKKVIEQLRLAGFTIQRANVKCNILVVSD
jgi:thiol-disulfide isomerase/thioredoxin